jgi:hypothetical protein
MWRILSSLWNRSPARPPPAADAPVPEPDEPDDTDPVDDVEPREGEVSPAPEPFPVIEGSTEGYRPLGIVGWEYEGHGFRALDPDGREVVLRQFAWEPGTRTASRLAGLVEPFRTLWHPSLLRPRVCFVGADQLTLVTERTGDDLGAWLDRRRAEGQPGIPAAPLLGYLGEVAEALDYLQARGVCHRRLQPEHLVLRNGRALVEGYVTIPAEELPSQHHLAPPRQVLQVMSPEEWRSGRAPGSHPYKLGVLYHYLRTGRFAFAGSVLMELALQIVQGTPDLSALPEAERPVVARALAREPRERHGSCVELVRALKSAVAPGCGRPSRARRRADPAWLAWNGGTVRTLARAVHDDNAFERLPVLADALEDAGCADADLLGHLREPGPHVRGCWAVGLLLREG